MATPAWTGQFISAREPDGIVGVRWEIDVPELMALEESHTFGEGLQALLEAAVSGSLQKILKTDSAVIPRLEVRFSGPLPQAGIAISSENGRSSFSNTVAYGEFPKCDVDMSALFDWVDNSPPFLGERSDLQTTLHFGTRTILTLGELLRSKKVSQ
jgi:hypothetical protein